MMKGSGVFEALIWDQQLFVCACFPPAALSHCSAQEPRPTPSMMRLWMVQSAQRTQTSRHKCFKSPAPSERCCMSADNS